MLNLVEKKIKNRHGFSVRGLPGWPRVLVEGFNSYIQRISARRTTKSCHSFCWTNLSPQTANKWRPESSTLNRYLSWSVSGLVVSSLVGWIKCAVPWNCSKMFPVKEKKMKWRIGAISGYSTQESAAELSWTAPPWALPLLCASR